MNRADDVLITGMGAVSAAGLTLAEALQSFASGTRTAGPVTLFETTLANPVFEVRGLPGTEERTVRLALHALREALGDAGLPERLEGLRVGVAMGTTVASQLNDLPFYTAYRRNEPLSLQPVERFLKGNLADAIARATGAAGPRIAVVNACSSSADAIGAACSWLRAGLCDVALAGGGDELNRVPYSGFNSLSVYSPELCAPYDRDRKGLNLGEGAGVLVLETRGHAAARGRAARVTLAGYGSACDAYHMTAPRPDGTGLEAAIRRALDEAGIAPAAVAFVNAHGTATRDNDRVEGTVLARVFGPEVKVLSTKGFTGHTLGAAGALEAAFTAAGLREGWIPASAGFVNQDEEIPIGALRERTAVRGRYALSTSLAFGGNNAALVIGLDPAADAGGPRV